MKERTIMKKLFAIILALVMAVSLAACSETNVPETPVDTSEPVPASEPDGAEDVLSFIGKDEIYFDVHLTDGLFDKTSIKVGDKVLTESGKATYTGTEDIVFEGTTDRDDDVYLVILSLKEGERATSDYTIVDASALADMLARKVSIHKTGKDKILVIVTDTKDGYDHTFDAALADMIKIALQG